MHFRVDCEICVAIGILAKEKIELVAVNVLY